MKKRILALSILSIIVLGCEKEKIEKDFFEKKIDSTESKITEPSSDTTQKVESTESETAKTTKTESKDINKKSPKSSNTTKKNSSAKKTSTEKKDAQAVTSTKKTPKATGRTYGNIGEALKTLGDLLAKDKNSEAVKECNRIIASPSIVPDISGNIDSFHYFRLSAWFKMKDYLRVEKECNIFDKKFPNSKYASGVNGLRQGVEAMRKAGLVK